MAIPLRLAGCGGKPHRKAMSRIHRTRGWKLDRAEREALLQRFPPRYERAVADHVTFKPGPDDDAPMPQVDHCLLAGIADDGEGVQALVVSLAGGIDRPDGSTWHITWSLGPGRRAKESNDVIAAHGWQPFPEPLRIALRAAEWNWQEEPLENP